MQYTYSRSQKPPKKCPYFSVVLQVDDTVCGSYVRTYVPIALKTVLCILYSIIGASLSEPHTSDTTDFRL